MQDKKNIFSENNVNNEFEEDDDERRKGGIAGFLLLALITTVGVMFALGLSFSAIKLMDSNETINTLISSLTGDDNQDKYIITYVESTGDTSNQGLNDSIYISNAAFSKAENGGSGEVLYFGGLLLTTRNTFDTKDSKITYEITLVNGSQLPKTFYGLNYDPNSNVKYTISGINEGDVIEPGKSVKAYVTVEYVDNAGNNGNGGNSGGSNGNDNDFPKTIESSVECKFEQDGKAIHIEKVENYKSTNGGSGEVVYYGGMMLTTKTTLTKENSTVTYKITLKNDSTEVKTYNGINFNQDPNVKYTISGIKEGDKINPGSTKVIYLVVEGNKDVKYPITVESTIEIDTSDFGVSNGENGIYLVNQFPTSDEVGKQFQGTNYVYTFSLIVGKKTVGAYYEITLVPNSDNTLDPNYVKVYLEKNKQGVDLSYRKNGRVKVFTEYSESENGADGKVIYKGNITEEDAKLGKLDFVMRMWITEDLHLSEDMLKDYVNRKFSATVNTYATFTNK